MNKRIAAAWLTAFSLLIGGCACLTAPSAARTLNTDSWSGQVGPYEEDAAVIESPLLKPGGQRVLLDMRNGSFVIPVTFTANDDVSGELNVTVNDGDWFTVLPTQTELSFTEGETRAVDLTVTMITPASEPEARTRETDTSQAQTTVPEDGPAETTSAPGPGETTAAPGPGETTAAPETEPSRSETTSAEPADPETSAPETTAPDAGEPEPEDPGGAGPETTEEPEDTGEPEEPLTEPIPSRLSFDVSFTNETVSMTATFEMIDEETRRSEFPESMILNGVFSDPLGWYTSEYPMLMTLSGAARLKISSAEEDEPQKFPAGTAYEFDGHRIYLYDPGFIDVGGAGNLIIYLSDTDLSGTLKLYTDSSNCEIREIDGISDSEGGTAVIALENETSIGLPYSWGGVTAEVSAERLLVQQDKSVIWNIAQNISIESDEDGCISLNTVGAPAGTYRIYFSWTLNDNTLYGTEMIVFVRHRSGGQGGHSR